MEVSDGERGFRLEPEFPSSPSKTDDVTAPMNPDDVTTGPSMLLLGSRDDLTSPFMS